jgi:hypothetical protein
VKFGFPISKGGKKGVEDNVLLGRHMHVFSFNITLSADHSATIACRQLLVRNNKKTVNGTLGHFGREGQY